VFGNESCVLNQTIKVRNSLGRLRTDRIVRVHIGPTNDPSLIDYVSDGHRKSVFRFVVEPVQGATEGLVKVPQVILQREDKPELLCRLEVTIGLDVEAQVQLLVHTAGIAFEFGSHRHDPCSKSPDLGIDFLL